MQERHSRAKAERRLREQREEGHDPSFPHNWTYISGTMYEMPIEKPLDQTLTSADNAVKHAMSVRKAHARKSKRGSQQRETDIRLALERIRDAMRPIRRRIARTPYSPDGSASQGLREASQRLQAERRKLWKMKQQKAPK